jgi:hypothetical protein
MSVILGNRSVFKRTSESTKSEGTMSKARVQGKLRGQDEPTGRHGILEGVRQPKIVASASQALNMSYTGTFSPLKLEDVCDAYRRRRMAYSRI